MPTAGGWGTSGSRATDTSGLALLVGGAVVVAGLYFARDVLIPFALALLLTFLLAPLVIRLRRSGLGRIPSVLITVSAAFATIAVIGWIVTAQLVDLASRLPQYQQNISQKLHALESPRDGVLTRTSRMLAELNREFAAAGTEGQAEGRPMQVQVLPPDPNPVDLVRGYAGPLLGPLAMIGVVVVLVIFMLIQREDLRDRFIGLVGTSRMNLTTQALDDAGGRISRYLRMQLLVNVSYGIPVGVGLYLIGVPNALLWGVLAAALRFVPYIGPLMAMVMPLVLAFAVDPGWNLLLMTAGLFVVAELVSNNVIEPWLYGASTGISSVAIMVAAIFWSSLWGPIGLLLSTPLTVCLAVAGRHVPQLSFLGLLLGNEPALRHEARVYQRLLAADAEEATEVAAELLEQMPLAQIYDEVMVPALSLAETDRHEGLLDEQRKRFVLDNTRELISELAELRSAPGSVAIAPSSAARGPIICIPARDESDEIAGIMLQALLRRDASLDIEVLAASQPVDEQLAHIRLQQPALVCVSCVPPAAVRSAVYVCKRLRADSPDLPVLVGLWSVEADVQHLRARVTTSLADRLVTRISAAAEDIGRLATPKIGEMTAAPVPANEEARLEAVRSSGLLDTAPEEPFDRLTRRLTEIFEVPVSLLTVIDENRQFWKSQQGLSEALAAARSAARATSICGHVVAEDEAVIVEDVFNDPRFAGNAFLRENEIRFYAGAPLRTKEGLPIGSLCIIDHRPRHFSERDRQLLELLAETAMGEIQARSELARQQSKRADGQERFTKDLDGMRAIQRALEPAGRMAVGESVIQYHAAETLQAHGRMAVVRTRDDGRVALAIGDAGSGSVAAMLTTVISTHTARLLDTAAAPADVVRALRQELAGAAQGLAVSLTIALFDPRTGRTEIAAAGHYPPIRIGAGTATPLAIEMSSPLFGGDGGADAAGATVTLLDGEGLLFYSDAAVEVGGDGEELMGTDGLARLVTSYASPDAEELLPWLASSLALVDCQTVCTPALLTCHFRRSGAPTQDAAHTTGLTHVA